jgi:hypothetical protein
MADQAFIIPRRNDLDGMNIQVTDLWPSESQKNNVYDGYGQAGYVKWSADAPGTTQVDGDSYAGGSTQTQPLVALVADDTTGAGNDVGVASTAEFGLAAYFLDRIDAGAVGAPLTPGQATIAANALFAGVEAGNSPTLAYIDSILNAQVAGSGLANGLSFGTVEEVLRILRGEVFRVRALSIITDQTLAVFLGLPARQAIVDAQTPDMILAEGQFYAQGDFLAAGEPGYRAFRALYRNSHFEVSNGEGVLHTLKGNIDWSNPNFAYTAAGVGVLTPRALTLDGTAIPETGIAPAILVVDADGNII